MPASLLLLFIFSGPPHAPPDAGVDVYVYHDAAYFHTGYFDVPKRADPLEFHRLMSLAICDELGRRGVPAKLLGARDWAKICRAKRKCIVVDLGQSVPATVYHGQDDGSPLEEWLDAGGILCYAGDWVCHWYALEGGGREGQSAGQRGDDDVFDADLVKADFVGIRCNPTPEAKSVLPAFRGWASSRPFDADAVQRSCEWYEIYGLGERKGPEGTRRAADPLAFRVPQGRGYFFGCRFARSAHTDSAQMVLDFILKRGLGLLREGDPK